jgi:hypothetical protein
MVGWKGRSLGRIGDDKIEKPAIDMIAGFFVENNEVEVVKFCMLVIIILVSYVIEKIIPH